VFATRAPFPRLLPPGLPAISERYAEKLLATIWDGIRPDHASEKGSGRPGRGTRQRGERPRRRAARDAASRLNHLPGGYAPNEPWKRLVS
jgi:hypothetical protein